MEKIGIAVVMALALVLLFGCIGNNGNTNTGIPDASGGKGNAGGEGSGQGSGSNLGAGSGGAGNGPGTDGVVGSGASGSGNSGSNLGAGGAGTGSGSGGSGAGSAGSGNGAGAGGVTATSGGSGTSGKDPINLIPSGDSITIPINSLNGNAKFYLVDFGLNRARFFAVKGSDGKVHVALDACDVCGGRKGYRQVGDAMVCNNCGKNFRINDIGSKNSAGGGCWPSYLSYKIDGENIVLEKAELGKNTYRFN